MANGKITVRLSARLPWWWRGYLAMLYAWHLCSLPVNIDAAAGFLARNIRITADTVTTP